tara:strand:+ start:140 stop:895 length:756 start_codon:yes stop_codon:yes gene_type:complete
MINLMRGDCLERMKEIPDGSVDMVLTDPPYGTTECKWDSAIPLDQMWEQLNRIIKPKGAIVLTSTQPFTTKLISSNYEMFKYCWYWKKSKATGHLNAKAQPMRNVEDVLIFSNGKATSTSLKHGNAMTYNPQGTSECNLKRINGKMSKEGHYSNKPSRAYKSSFIQEKTGYPKQLIEFKSVAKTVHHTQKPVPLMEYLIKTYTNEGETVLDFTMGSGTTGVACVNTGRNFIGIEMDENYFEIASKRIGEAQ